MIVRSADPEEYYAIYDLVDKAFKQSELERTIIEVTTGKDLNFQKGDLRVVEADRRIAGIMMLTRRQLRIGTAIVNGAIVAPVATHPDYQGKGYCSAVMRNAIDYMKNQGFDITILWGAPWLYPHYGYSPAMMRTELVVEPKQSVSAERNQYEFRPFAESDLKQMTRIYHNNTATRTCAEIRSPNIWEWKLGGAEAKVEVLIDGKGEVIGYRALGTDWGRPCVHEIGALNDEVCSVIFNSLLENCGKRGLKMLYCIIHPDHPFTHFAFWHGGEIRIRSGGGAGMARVLNLVSLLTKMEKEFERRLGRSEFHDLECTLKISNEEESTILDIDRGQASIAIDNVKGDYQLEIPLASLNPLITGYKDISELAKDPNVKVGDRKQAVRLIETLFPRGFPFGGHLPLIWE